MNIEYGYKSRADNLWSYVALINYQITNLTGQKLWHIVNDIETTYAAMFMWHFMTLGKDTEECGLPKSKSDTFLRNICSNGLFKKGKFYLSDWNDPEIGWLNYLLDVLVVKGDISRSGKN